MASSTNRRRSIAGMIAAGLLLSACWGGGDEVTSNTLDPSADTTVVVDDDPIVTVEGLPAEEPADDADLAVSLSEGSSDDEVAEPTPVTEGSALESDQVDEIVDELPEWSVPDTDEEEFLRPPDTLLPPEIGVTVDGTFPPDDDAPVEEPVEGPLHVLRYQPEGEVDVAPFIAVTFDQPMVPLSTLDQLDEAEVPVVVTPEIDGRWRWIGTRTLRFEVFPGEIDRLPAATRYFVEVPAGTRSETGGVLEESVAWSFTTPTPTLRGLAGITDSMNTKPIWVATFDQLVEPTAVVSAITVTAGGEDVPIRVATEDEVAADDVARNAYQGALEGRAVAFTPASELPVDTAVEIAVGPDVPSAEGPLTSSDVERFTGATFGALQVIASRCGYEERCQPGQSFQIEFSNALDPAEFDAEFVRIEPAVPGLRIDVYGSTIELRGATAGRTEYTVTLDGALTDVFGQQLGTDAEVTFDVGTADPALRGLSNDFITTDPTADVPTVSIDTINHDAVRVRAWSVTPPQFVEYRTYVESLGRDEDAPEPEWPLAYEAEVEIDATEDRWTETAIDLTDAFNASNGQLVVRVDPLLDLSESDDAYWANQPTVSWVQNTTLGIDAIRDGRSLVIVTTDLATGEPIGDVPVELIGDGRVATTHDDGLIEIELSDEPVSGLYGNAGDRRAFLPADEWDGWTAEGSGAEGRWFVFDDRGIYRPGETAHLTGWVRRFDWSDGAQFELYDDASTIEWQAYDAQGADLGSGTLELSALGRFTLDLELPEGANLGPAYVEFSIDDTTADDSDDGDDSSDEGREPGFDSTSATTHTIQVQEFRRPEFEVSTRVQTPAPHYAAEPATVAVDAEYFAGGPLPDAEVDWLVSTTETSYTPPNRDDYSFGVWQPWWYGDGGFRSAESDVAYDLAEPVDCWDCGPVGDTTYEEFSGRTDASGSHYLQLQFGGSQSDGEDDGEGDGDGDDGVVDLPSTVTAQATVYDVNRQAWASSTDLLVHPSEVYVGLRSDRNFVRQGTPIRIDAVVTDVDGELVAGRPVEITAGRLDWTFDGTDWTEELVDPQTCTLESTDIADDGSMRCEFSTDVGGTYEITAIVTDETGDPNRTEITQWVSGGTGRPVRNVEQEAVTIVPDGDEYAPGDTAELLVQAPFAPAWGTVTVAHHDIVSTEAFEAGDGSAVVEVPITGEHVPNLTVQIDMTGSAPRYDDDGNARDDLPPRPAYATGTIDLPVPPTNRTLDVTVTPAADAVEPGTDTSVTVSVVDPDGAAVDGAEVAVVVVDEAVLSLTGYDLSDPVEVFYRNVWAAIRSTYLRSTIRLASTVQLDGEEGDMSDGTVPASAEEPADESASDDAGGADLGEAGDGAGRTSTPTIDVRTDFDAVAVYAPSEVTGADGTVTVDVPLPDNLTRYRVMAVAVDGTDQFGKGESAITARLPLMVRTSAPRFLNFGDQFELPVVLQNQTEEPLDVDVVVQVANLALSGPSGKRVTVPANDRVEVRFPIETIEAGTARVRVAAVSGDFTDASEITLPVYTPATSEAFAVYGTIDEGAIGQPLQAPADVIPQYGGLEIGTSSTAVQALTDAVLYLEDYQYQSSDGYASRIMAVAALRDVLEEFDAAGLPPTAELEQRVASDITRLTALQNDDGGFPYWQRGRDSIPWNSVQSAHALVLADQAGYVVSADALERALAFIAEIEAYIPTDYPDDVRNSIRAYALYVRNEAGRRDDGKAAELFVEVGDDLALDALAHIWPSITDPDLRVLIERRFANSVVETPGGATFAVDYGESDYLIAQSDRRSDGIILDALITEQPDSDLIPKVVSGLLSRQENGRWNNAQENSFILLAMHRYFETFEDVDPSFVARAWLGETYVAESEFEGRTTTQVSTLVPMSELTQLAATDDTPNADGDNPLLVMAKDGEGRLYYRLGLNYAPTDLRLDARDEGFVVEREYESIGDETTVSRDDDGTWRIEPGATVRVRVTMVADARRTHVALVDPLPAGLEPLNPALAVTPEVAPDDEEGSGDGFEPWSWWWSWFEHQNLRDDRAEAFTTYLGGGTYEYTYLARATTPGTFVVPPTKAEEIYSPEVFGRSSTDTVVVG